MDDETKEEELHGNDSTKSTQGDEDTADVAAAPTSPRSTLVEGDPQHHEQHDLPPLPERTMKEMLVERERQARVETERARLKRQFALQNGGEGGEEEEEESTGAVLVGVDSTGSVHGSVNGTMGSSVLAAHDEHHGEEVDEDKTNRDNEALGYAMERFLSEREQQDLAADTDAEDAMEAQDGGAIIGADAAHLQPAENVAGESVVMERFLSSPAVVPTAVPPSQIEHLDQSAFHVSSAAVAGSLPSYSTTEGEEERKLDDLPSFPPSSFSQASGFSSSLPSSSITFDAPPRRLTEREIQEMAAIEEASIGNAPPSERGSVSEVGDFVPVDNDADAAFSARTHTTASVSITNDDTTAPAEPQFPSRSVDGLSTVSVSSQQQMLSPQDDAVASVESVASVTANPPSLKDEDVVESTVAVGASFEDKHDLQTNRQRSIAPDTPEEMKRGVLMVVDDFDYNKFDKNNISNVDDLFLTTPQSSDLRKDEQWPSPLQIPQWDQDRATRVGAAAPFIDTEQGGPSQPPLGYPTSYGALNRKEAPIPQQVAAAENQPLLRGRGSSMSNQVHDSQHSHFGRFSMGEIAGSVFSSIRSDSESTIQSEINEADKYMTSSIFLRAFPERMAALFVTLLVEIPVLLMISGGSDRLCMLIGRRRYQLMMGFLPLSSAISGNCGLQASTLTTRAISHNQVTPSNYSKWLSTEVGAALCLGLGMGIVLGSYAYLVSGMDFAFGMTIFVAQLVSIITAGCTGTLAPLLFSFIFRRDSGKWGGPLETAIQDIVGSFAMVVMSYRLLLLFGPADVDPEDVCG